MSEEENAQAAAQARTDFVNQRLHEVETSATFKLKSMTRDFTTDYVITLTDLKIPTGYDLEKT